MVKGGYQIVDFKDTNITTGTPVVITGVYSAIENNYRKPILIAGITIDGVEKADCFVDCTLSDGSFTFSIYGKNATIANDDTVTLAAAAA